MERYEELEISVIRFDSNDVIVTSGCETYECTTDGSGLPDF